MKSFQNIKSRMLALSKEVNFSFNKSDKIRATEQLSFSQWMLEDEETT
jgi:hypothetical protein